MKYLFIFLAASMLWACNSNNATTGSETEATTTTATSPSIPGNVGTDALTSIQWVDSTHQELGKINEGQVVEISWVFKNTGNKPLIISNVSASCGCTVAEKPEEPIAPGKEGIIKAKFDSNGRVGPQHKDVYMEANTTGSRTTQLSFALEVLKK